MHIDLLSASQKQCNKNGSLQWPLYFYCIHVDSNYAHPIIILNITLFVTVDILH